jgi:hypothetical protein
MASSQTAGYSASGVKHFCDAESKKRIHIPGGRTVEYSHVTAFIVGGAVATVEPRYERNTPESEVKKSTLRPVRKDLFTRNAERAVRVGPPIENPDSQTNPIERERTLTKPDLKRTSTTGGSARSSPEA